MKTPSLWMIAAVCFVAPTSVAHARTAYDGSWDLVFVTQRGSCDPSYNFTVNVSDGAVTHPNLVKFKGYVAKSVSVHASVTVHDKFAPGTGRLFGTSVAVDGATAREARDAAQENLNQALRQVESLKAQRRSVEASLAHGLCRCGSVNGDVLAP